jgi:hypothetical protein
MTVARSRKHLNIGPTVVFVDSYQGSRGQVLRVDIQSFEALMSLRAVFHELSQNKVRKIGLASLNFVALAPGLKDVVLEVIENGREPSRTVKLVRDDSTQTVFFWTRQSEGWLESAELLDQLSQPGHQYLSRGSSDDAEVEVSFRETVP